MATTATATPFDSHFSTPLASHLARKFAQMSADRDVPATSKTDVQTFPVDGGYVQEVVSVAPPLTTAGGEQATVVTKRRTVTTSSQRSTSPRPSDAASVASYDSSAISAPYATYSAPRETTLPRMSPANNRTTTSPYRPNGSAQWVAMPRPTAHEGSHAPREPRNVAFGATDTKVVEPSRVSPLHVDRDYAPVRYITKRELRRLRMHQSAQDYGGSMLPNSIRRSSVPRLDAIRREQELVQRRIPTGAAFSPHGPSFPGAPPAPREEYPGMLEGTEWGSPAPRLPQRDSPQPQRYAFQAGYEDGDSTSEQQLRYQRALDLEHAQRSAAAAIARQESELQLQQRLASQQHEYSAQERFLMQREANFVAEQQRATAQLYQQHQQLHTVLPPAARPVIVPLTPDGQSFEKCAVLIAAARRLSTVPNPPHLAREAFQLLHRGTYLIKYPSTGSPHERYFTVRIMPSEFRRDLQPYLCWSIHADSQNIKDRLHLAHLIGVSTTDQSENFLRHRIEPGVIRGPYVGGARQTLPTTFAISLLFQSPSAVRSVDMLALDDQTFRCWLLVLKYFVSINTMQDAGSVVPEVETVPPESPRSVSAHSARQ